MGDGGRHGGTGGLEYTFWKRQGLANLPGIASIIHSSMDGSV